MVAIDNFILLALCLTFGGATNPSQWSDMSKLICNLANAIVCDIGWDPLVLCSPHQDLISMVPSLEAPKIPMAQASTLAVELPPDDEPKSNCYIDDLIAAFLEHDHTQGTMIIPFVIHLLGHPMADTKTLLQDDILSLLSAQHLKNVLPLVQNDNYSEPKLVCRQLFSNVYEDIKSVYTFFQFLSQQISK